MTKADKVSLKELIEKTQKDWIPVSVEVKRTKLTARELIEGMKLICDDNPECHSCPLAHVSSCVRPDPEVIDIVRNYIDNKYFGCEG